MKIKCVDLYDEYKKQSPWLTIDKEYIALEVDIRLVRNTYYRLVANNKDKMPALYSSTHFEIVTELIPSNWIISVVNKRLILSPKNWTRVFWESYYNQDPKAHEIYNREARIIYEEEGEIFVR